MKSQTPKNVVRALFEAGLELAREAALQVGKKNGERLMLGHPRLYVRLLWFYVEVQCFIFTFDVFLGGGSRV